MNKQMVRVVRIDANRMMAQDMKQEFVAPGQNPEIYRRQVIDIEGEKFPVWDVDLPTAQQMIHGGADRYKLYQSPSLAFPVQNSGTGIFESVTYYPWYARKVTRKVLDEKTGKVKVDEENGEELYETVIEWREDEKEETVPKVSPSSSTAATAAPAENTSKLKQKLDEVEDRCGKMEKGIIQRDAQLKKQKEENEALKKKIEELEKKHDSKDSKGK